MTKTFQHLKQCQPTPFLSVFSLESVTIAACFKFYKSPKTAIAFETSFFLVSLIKTPLFTGDVFQCNADRTCWMIQTHSADEVNLGRRRTFHELNSLYLTRLMKSLTFELGLRLLKEDPDETLFKIFLASFNSFFPFLSFFYKWVCKKILEEMLRLLTMSAAKRDLKKALEGAS